MTGLLRFLAMLGLAGLGLTGCGQRPAYQTHQSLLVPGLTETRRVEILEDSRLTPAMRNAMWGGSKNPADFLAAPGVTLPDSVRAGILRDGLRHAMIRLVDGSGAVLTERILDCELAEIIEPALPQADHAVWAMGNDCSVGVESHYAGMITRFFTVAPEKILWQSYHDTNTSEHLELTLVEAGKIKWHLASPGRAETILEVSSHPDFDDPRFKSPPSGAAPPINLPEVTDYIRYSYAGQNEWQRVTRTEAGAAPVIAGFPDAARFPP